MRKIIYSGIIFICCMAAKGQTTFQRTYSGTPGPGIFDQPVRFSYAVNTTNDGGYILGANPSETCSGPASLIKTDANGDTLWTRTFDFGGTAENVRSVEQTSDGGFIAGINDGTMTILKTDASGNFTWSKKYGGSLYEIYSVHQTSDNGYIIGGSGMGKGCLIKTNNIGDTLWTRTYGGAQGEKFISAIETSDGGYIATGRTGSYVVGGGTSDGYVVKTNSNGDTLWTKVYGTSAIVDNIIDVVETTAGYVFAGNVDYGIILFKTNYNGNIIWTKQFADSNSYGIANSMVQTNDGGFALTGYSLIAGNIVDVLLLKTDSSGNYLWSKLYGGLASDYGYSIHQTFDAGFIISGQFSGPACLFSESGAYLIKVDSMGFSSCNSSPGNFIQTSFSFIIGQGANIGSGCTVNALTPSVSNTNIIDSIFCITAGTFELKSIYHAAKVYPNPAVLTVMIEFNNPEKENSILKIFDTDGRLVKTFANIKTNRILVVRKNLKAGLYFFLLCSETKIIAKGKFVFE